MVANYFSFIQFSLSQNLKIEAMCENEKFRCIFNIQFLQIIEKTSNYGTKVPNKVIVIKIGHNSIKCGGQNQIQTLTTQLLYSKTSAKFCSLKGIVKIYDVTSQGNQIISCVGAFNTDELLCLQGSQKQIQKDIGPIILRFNIKTIIEKISNISTIEQSDSLGAINNTSQSASSHSQNSGLSKANEQKKQEKGEILIEDENIEKKYEHIKQQSMDKKISISGSEQIQSHEDNYGLSSRIATSVSSNFFSSNNLQLNQVVEDFNQNQNNKQDFTKCDFKKIRIVDIQSDQYSIGLSKGLGLNKKNSLAEESSIKNQSFQNSNASLTFHELYEQYHKSELSMIGQELMNERRNKKILEERFQKQKLKVQQYKKKLLKSSQFEQMWNNICRKFIDNLAVDRFGEFLIELNTGKKILSFKLNQPHSNLEEQIIKFLNFIHDNVHLEEHKNKKISINKSITEQIQIVYEQNIRMRNERDDQQQNLHLYKKKYQQLNKKYKEIVSELNDKNQQIFALELKESQINDNIRVIEGMNLYLKEKDQQMQYIISTKQNTIDNLRKMLTSANNELDELEDENIHLKKTLRNCELMIEELKEEIATRDDTLEMYEEKYGAIKFQKNRELENQINDCLRWINQESKLHESMDETQRSDITIKQDRTLAIIVKNNEKIYGLGSDDLQRVKEQICGLMQQVSDFQAKLDQQNEMKNSILSQKSL